MIDVPEIDAELQMVNTHIGHICRSNSESICVFGGTIQRVKEMAGIGILCVFIILLGMLFVIVGIVWFLADCTVRKLEKVGCL